MKTNAFEEEDEWKELINTSKINLVCSRYIKRVAEVNKVETKLPTV